MGGKLPVLRVQDKDGLGAALMHVILVKGHDGLFAFQPRERIEHGGSGQSGMMGERIPIGTQEPGHGLEHDLIIRLLKDGRLDNLGHSGPLLKDDLWLFFFGRREFELIASLFKRFRHFRGQFRCG